MRSEQILRERLLRVDRKIDDTVEQIMQDNRIEALRGGDNLWAAAEYLTRLTRERTLLMWVLND